ARRNAMEREEEPCHARRYGHRQKDDRPARKQSTVDEPGKEAKAGSDPGNADSDTDQGEILQRHGSTRGLGLYKRAPIPLTSTFVSSGLVSRRLRKRPLLTVSRTFDYPPSGSQPVYNCRATQPTGSSFMPPLPL